MSQQVTIVDGDDQAGLYVNGQLKMQAHRFDLKDIQKIIELLTGTAPEWIEADADWMYEVRHLPESLSDVQGV